ncbi:response regulator transcription factor [Ciceribacter sp. RN22]|uniref:response regulator transcription factor n=1 Tax=Ciceribacter sp. RN22 TaxID=2954932 RepID=UPI00209217EC|nr:response regulator transcription factor [Ciceribacter sp. RN22]MCO6181016.1 response regulator transcription factor [Ciceribacter sp. RN22]
MNERERPPLNVILVEDDIELASEMRLALQFAGFVVHLADSAIALDRLLAEGTRGVILLDMILPGEDGLSIARRLAAHEDLRIVALTARASEQDRIDGVRAGADIYLTKPVNLDELIAVIWRVASRLPSAPSPTTLDKGRQLLTGENGTIVRLTTLECWFLACLAQAPNQSATRQEVERALWEGDQSLTDKRLDVLVHRLRAKLAAASEEWTDLIATQWRHGYTLLQYIRVI